MMPIKKHYKDLFRWSWQLHHSVNIKLEKPLISYDEALYLYQHQLCKNCHNLDDIKLEDVSMVNDHVSVVNDGYYNFI